MMPSIQRHHREGIMSIFKFIWWATLVSICAFAGYVYGYLSD